MSTTHVDLRRFALLVLPVALLLQSILLYMPTSGEAAVPLGLDKVVHFLMFGGPVVLALLAGLRWLPVLLVAYAPLSEVIQSLPSINRDPDWRDVVADITGIVVAWVLTTVWQRHDVR